MVSKTAVCILTSLKCNLINVWNLQEVKEPFIASQKLNPQHKPQSQLIRCSVKDCVVDLWQVKSRIPTMVVAERDEKSRQEGNLPPFVPSRQFSLNYYLFPSFLKHAAANSKALLLWLLHTDSNCTCSYIISIISRFPLVFFVLPFFCTWLVWVKIAVVSVVFVFALFWLG